MLIIAISDGKAYIVSLEMKHGALIYHAAEKISLVSTASTSETLIKAVIEKKLLTKSETYGEIKEISPLVALPEEQCYVHAIQLNNQTNQTNIAERIADEISRVMPIARNEAEIRWEYNKTKKRIVAAAAKKTDITSIRVLCERFQLGKIILYPEPLAIVASLQNQGTGGAIIIDCGEYRTNAVFFDEEGFLASYVLQKRTENIHSLIAKRFRVSFSQAQIMRRSIGMNATQEGGALFEFLKKDLDETWRECAHLLESARSQYQKPFVTFFFIGEIVDTPHLIESFHSQIGGAVALADPWHNIQSVPQHIRRDTGFAAALGVAMRSIGSSDNPPLNLNDSAPSHDNQFASVVALTLKNNPISLVRARATAFYAALHTRARRALFVAAAMMMVLIGIVLWKQFTPYQAVLPKEIELAIFVGDGDSNDAIRGKLWETTVSVTDTFATAGVTEISSYASGTIRIINETNNSINLRGATRLVYKDGDRTTIYQIPKAVVVPAHATKAVIAIASELGAKGNIPAGARMSFPGLPLKLQQSVYAEIPDSIENGVAHVPTITEEDILGAVSRLKQRAAVQALWLLKKQAEDERYGFLEEPLETKTLEENVFAKPGDMGETFSLSLRVYVSTISFPQDDAWKRIAKDLQWDWEDFAPQIDQEKEIQATLLAYNAETKVVRIRVLLSDNNNTNNLVE